MSCGGGCRRGLDSELLWVWRRLAAVALVGPLAWECLYAKSVALKTKNEKKTKNKKTQHQQKRNSRKPLIRWENLRRLTSQKLIVLTCVPHTTMR